MTIFQHADTIKAHILKQVEAFSLEQGISYPIGILTKNISLSREDIEYIVNPPPKKKKKNMKFNIKSKKKFNVKTKQQTDYNIFVSICDQHDLEYFEFYDEHNWCGPALKVDEAEYDIIVEYFNDINIHSVSGTDFYIIHPKNQCENNITYKEEPIESCKLEPTSLIIVTSEDEEAEAEESFNPEAEAEAEAEESFNPEAEAEESFNPEAEAEAEAEESFNPEADIYDKTTDDEAEAEDLELEEWTHENTNIKYLLDTSTNNLYSIQSTELIGVKINEFTIEFN